MKTPTAPSITQDQIDALLARADIHVFTIFDKVTMVAVRLENGFVLTESAGAVSKENYSEETGRQICLSKIEQQLWQLEGYRLQSQIREELQAIRPNPLLRGGDPQGGVCSTARPPHGLK